MMYLFHYKDRSILFPDLCSKDCDFWERILSLNSHVSLFYLLFYSLFYIHVVDVFSRINERGRKVECNLNAGLSIGYNCQRWWNPMVRNGV